MNTEDIKQIIDPVINAPIGNNAVWDSENNRFTINTPYIAHPEYGSHFTALNMTIRRGLQKNIQIETNYTPPLLSQQVEGNARAISGVKNIVAIGSGKGGVGKSTIATLIARASKILGARVGMLDADIYGPNQLRLMGIEQNKKISITEDKQFKPYTAHGIPTVSFAGVSDESTPVIWRGPMISSAVQQLLMQTDWPELDILFIDLPPGTGDIQLTIASSIRIAAFVLVTTPQALSVTEAEKTLAMTGKLRIPVAGYIENMASFICPNCQTEHKLFGSTNSPLINKLTRLGSFPMDQNMQNEKGELLFENNNASTLEAIQVAEAISLTLAKMDNQGNSIIARQ